MKQRKAKTPTKELNRYCCFEKSIMDEPQSDPILDAIARKITLLTLRVSHIENRIAEYETKRKDEVKEEDYFKEVRFDYGLPKYTRKKERPTLKNFNTSSSSTPQSKISSEVHSFSLPSSPNSNSFF